MDIKLKSSNDNKEFNDSRNNINGIKKSNYKGKVVIAILLVIAIIATEIGRASCRERVSERV